MYLFDFSFNLSFDYDDCKCIALRKNISSLSYKENYQPSGEQVVTFVLLTMSFKAFG